MFLVKNLGGKEMAGNGDFFTCCTHFALIYRVFICWSCFIDQPPKMLRKKHFVCVEVKLLFSGNLFCVRTRFFPWIFGCWSIKYRNKLGQRCAKLRLKLAWSWAELGNTWCTLYIVIIHLNLNLQLEQLMWAKSEAHCTL